MQYSVHHPNGALLGRKVIPSRQGAEFCLERGELFRLEADPRERVVQVLDGRVWLTQSGNGADVVLEKDQTYRISGPELVLFEGLPAARLRFLEK